MISVVCPTYNEEKYIAKCIDSILAQDYPKEDMEVLLIDGMSKDHTREIVADYQKHYPFIQLLDNPHQTVPYAMNIGIKASQGDIIIRLDAHAYYPTNYFSQLVAKLDELNADNVGGVCRTDMLNKTRKTNAIREVLCNKFGVGNSTFRIGVTQVMEVDTVPFGCWKRETFHKYGLYDVRLNRNQDIELNKRIAHNGGKIYLIPDTYSTYYARETFEGIAKNNFQNGKWNILTVFYTKQFHSLSIRHFIPLCFLLSLMIPILAAMLYAPIMILSLLSLILYMLLLGVVSLNLSITKHLSFIYILWSFMVLHFSYGAGSLTGIFIIIKINNND